MYICRWNPAKHNKRASRSPIHRMQIWRTSRSSPGTSCMKARLVGLTCFVLTILLHKSLASSSIWSTLFRCSYGLLCFWMLREGTELFRRSPRKLRENNGDEGKEFTFTAELKFVRYISGYNWKIFEKITAVKIMTSHSDLHLKSHSFILLRAESS